MHKKAVFRCKSFIISASVIKMSIFREILTYLSQAWFRQFRQLCSVKSIQDIRAKWRSFLKKFLHRIAYSWQTKNSSKAFKTKISHHWKKKTFLLKFARSVCDLLPGARNGKWIGIVLFIAVKNVKPASIWEKFNPLNNERYNTFILLISYP